MNVPPKISMVDRSTIVRFFRWGCSWRGLRCFLLIIAWPTTLVALFYGEENWRGSHAWNKYRHELENRGEQLDFRSLIPKPVPDDQNFAATPYIQTWFERPTDPGRDARWEDNYSRAVSHIHEPKDKSSKAHRHPLDLASWQWAFRFVNSGELDDNKEFGLNALDSESRTKAAPAVLEGLADYDAIIAELRSASSRAKVRYPVNYNLENPWAILIPHLARVKEVCQRLQLKASAELALGQTDRALEDTQLALFMTDSLQSEPLLIGYLVRVGCLQIALQPIWEGLAENRWSDAQLQELQTRLENYDFLADLKPPLAMERAAALETVDLVRRKGNLRELSSPDGSNDLVGSLLCALCPRGWYSLEKLNYCRLIEIMMVLDLQKKRISPPQAEASNRHLESALAGNQLTRFSKHRLFAGLLLPALLRLQVRAAVAQTSVNEAAIACALERYRMANGKVPESLVVLKEKLLPQVPNDVLTGEAYKYRRSDDGQFVLYSVGWNGRDEGGVSGKTLFDEKQGDWVWDYPPK